MANSPARTMTLGAALGAAAGSALVALLPGASWQVSRVTSGLAATFGGALVGLVGGAILAWWSGR